ncbi:Exochitinase 1 [Burkholderiales bacterium]|nr:Exochitinase 1 [Burkholderiales bacterium]
MASWSFAKACIALVATLSWNSSLAVATVEHDSNPIATPSYKITLTQSSVSGISSGGYMAQQFHVANSAWMVGSGIFAGGPYYCAENNVSNGTGRCVNGGITQAQLDSFLSEANNQAAAGRIDAVSNLANDRVWLFHGKLDQGVDEQVMDSLKTWYEMAGVAASNITYERERIIQHTWPTKYYNYPGDSHGNTNACAGSGPDYPFLGACDWDSAGDMLAHIYGPLNPRNAGNLTGTVKAIRQSDHFNAGGYGSPASMNPKAYVYVPASCANGTECRLHVAFHGCEMNYDSAPSIFSSDAGPVYGLKFVLNSGLNEWADTNDIVVLYPQAKKSSSNPKGCWDFWNYEGGGVPHTKRGKQIDTVRAMMTKLAAGMPGDLPPPPTGLAATGTTSNSVSLNWNGVSGATGYKVYRGTAGVGTPSGASFTDTGLSPSTTYTYQVAAINAAGEGPKSEAMNATTQAGSGGACFTANNVAHVSAGRAYLAWGLVYARGSNESMGFYSALTTTKLRQTATDYYVVDSTCP